MSHCALILYTLGKIKHPQILKAFQRHKAAQSEFELRDTAVRALRIENVPAQLSPILNSSYEVLTSNLSDDNASIRAKVSEV
jgi:hypothetical protein